jgi:hypothetical protein
MPDRKYAGFFRNYELIYGSIHFATGLRVWDCEIKDDAPTSGKMSLPNNLKLEGCYYEGPITDLKPSGKGAVKKTSDNSLVFNGVWSAGVLTARTGPWGVYRGKFDGLCVPIGFVRVFNSNNEETFFGKVDGNLSPVGKSFSGPSKERRPQGAFVVDEEKKLEFSTNNRFGSYSKVSRKFGCLHSVTDRWSYVGALEKGKRLSFGVEVRNGATYFGTWSDDVRDGFGQLRWPQEVRIASAREYAAGRIVSEREAATANLILDEKLRVLAVRSSAATKPTTPPDYSLPFPVEFYCNSMVRRQRE